MTNTTKTAAPTTDKITVELSMFQAIQTLRVLESESAR